MNKDNVDTLYKPDAGLRIGLGIAQETLHDLHRQSLQLGYLAMSLMQQASCKSWVGKVKSKQYAGTNAGRPKSETSQMLTLIDHPTQEQQAALIQQAPANQDIADLTCTHASGGHGMILEQDQQILIGQPSTLAVLSKHCKYAHQRKPV